MKQNLYIEAIFSFGELQTDQEAIPDAIPTFFESFVVGTPGYAPYLRIRLEATWRRVIMLTVLLTAKFII